MDAGWSPGGCSFAGWYFLLVGASLAPLAPGLCVSQPPRGGGKPTAGTVGSSFPVPGSFSNAAHGVMVGRDSFSQAFFWAPAFCAYREQPSPGKLQSVGEQRCFRWGVMAKKTLPCFRGDSVDGTKGG